MKRIKLPTHPTTREEALADDPLREYFVWWDDIKIDHITKFEQSLKTATNEAAVQKFLEKNPMVLIQHLGGGHGRWVLPQKRLGSEYVTDFMIGERSSLGFEWYAVEIESPTAPMFNKSGGQSKALAQAIRQIQDWRSWLTRNQNYAARVQSEKGLGLTDIRPDLPGLILVGRRSLVNPKTKEFRRQISSDLNIQIHTYDFLLDSAKGRISSLSS